MNMKNTIQQGDVILRRIQTLPAGEKKLISKGKLVLAEGEVTGHYHGIQEKDSELYQLGEMIVLDLKAPSLLTHQEHHNIEIETGLWEVGRVKEYDYFAQMTRQVAD